MSRIVRVVEGHIRKGMAKVDGVYAKNSVEHQILARSKFLDIAPGKYFLYISFLNDNCIISPAQPFELLFLAKNNSV